MTVTSISFLFVCFSRLFFPSVFQETFCVGIEQKGCKNLVMIVSLCQMFVDPILSTRLLSRLHSHIVPQLRLFAFLDLSVRDFRKIIQDCHKLHTFL